jgi:hypothetical protein
MRVLWLLAATALACGPADDGTPRLDELAPPQGAVGATVNVLGIHFCADDACTPGFVSFGSTAAQIVSWSDDRVIVTVPSVVGATGVVLTVGGRQSNGLNFMVTP